MENSVSSAALNAAREQLDAAEAAREVILLQHIANGVIIDSRTVQIAPDVVIAPGAVILAGTILRGRTVIGAGCIIGPNTLIEDSIVDEGSTVNASQVYGSHHRPPQQHRPLHPCAGEHCHRLRRASGCLCGDQELQLCPGQHREPPDLHRRQRCGQVLQLRLRHRHLQLRRQG